MKKLDGKIVIVTGAGSGLGRTIAQYCAKRGALVVVADINLSSADETLHQIKEGGGEGIVVHVDVADPKAVDKMINKTMDQYGRIDFLFNNAGAALGGEFKDMTLEHWHNMMDVNFWSIIYACMKVYPIMIQQGSGHIVNVSSFAGLMPGGLMSSYSASKYAAVGFTLNLRSEARQYGIKVTALCPGYLETPMHKSAQIVTDYYKKHDEGYLRKKHNYPTPEACIDYMMRRVLKNKCIIVSPRKQIPIWWLNRLFPSLLPWIWFRVIQRIKKKNMK